MSSEQENQTPPKILLYLSAFVTGVGIESFLYCIVNFEPAKTPHGIAGLGFIAVGLILFDLSQEIEPE